MNLYVVRHGETIWNVEKKVQGITDIPLTENGKKEAEELLDCDPGLTSRIYQTISFENYDKEQLWEIAKVMAKKYDFEIAEDCKEIMEEYLEELSRNANYGNAREVRKLLQTVMEEYGLSEKTEKVLDLSCFSRAVQ